MYFISFFKYANCECIGYFNWRRFILWSISGLFTKDNAPPRQEVFLMDPKLKNETSDFTYWRHLGPLNVWAQSSISNKLFFFVTSKISSMLYRLPYSWVTRTATVFADIALLIWLISGFNVPRSISTDFISKLWCLATRTICSIFIEDMTSSDPAGKFIACRKRSNAERTDKDTKIPPDDDSLRHFSTSPCKVILSQLRTVYVNALKSSIHERSRKAKGI